MAGSTTNLGLTKPTYSEDADIAVINTNMDTLDSKIGAVGSTSLQAQITSANEAMSKLFALEKGQIIANSTNFNTLITPGNYAVISNNAASTMSNIPVSRAGSLYVKDNTLSGDNYYIQQLYVTYENVIYIRNTKDQGSTWETWDSIALNSVIAGQSVSGVDANNLTTTGRYLLNGNIANLPYGNYGYLDVIASVSNVVQYYSNLNAVSLYVRNKYSGTWTSWEQLALKSETQKFSFSTIVTDFNSALESGIYAGNSATNSPITGWVIVLTMRLTDNNNYIAQIALQFGNNYMYIRTRENGTWKSWKNVSAS